MRPQQVAPRTATTYHSGKVTKKTGTGVVYNCYSLHVRSGGSTKYKVIGYLQKGDKVTITGVCDTKWYEISFKGGKGYCSHKYINAKVEEPKPPPVEKPKENVKDKDFIDLDLGLLTGDLDIFPKFDIMPRDIIEVQGLGEILSGNYYVEKVKIGISSKGIDMSVGVSKNSFRMKVPKKEGVK